MKPKVIVSVFFMLLVACGAFTLTTYRNLRPTPTSLHTVLSNVQHLQVLDRNGQTLSISYQNRWNRYDSLPLYEIPSLLQEIFVASEDKRFFKHSGVDWRARLHALFQNIKALRKVRGASTISEQVVRLLHPRPRNLWSRWLEGWEAKTLEKQSTKSDILEFYLNQVPYAANRRGVLQAARYYFNRDLTTLSPKEMLALVVLVRAPSRLDPFRNPNRLEAPIRRLAHSLRDSGILDNQSHQAILVDSLTLERPSLPVHASHFIQYVREHTPMELAEAKTLHTSIEAPLQSWVQDRIDRRLKNLKSYGVQNGSVLVADHRSGQILTWVVAGLKNKAVPGRFIDAVTTPRQPGSTLKPFVYAMALESAWTAATLIADTPLSEALGHGLHSFQNYSRHFYGPITLREALGNSLNIPAIRTVRHVGVEPFLQRLHALGFASLREESSYYGDGLALGNGEVSLFELVQAYMALANRGRFRPLQVLDEASPLGFSRQIFEPEVSSLIANILSDPDARRLEFGRNSVLHLPVQTAVKTGTSSDYRDAWAVGFDNRYVVGVWMGNLDQSATKGLTGSRGPALLLRSIFARLEEHEETRPLYLSPRLVQRPVCIDPLAQTPCVEHLEWFLPENLPQEISKPVATAEPIQLRQPSSGLHLACDPRIPDSEEAFEFLVSGLADTDYVEWWLNDQLIARTEGGHYLWPLQKGEHQLFARILRDGKKMTETDVVNFSVR